MLRSLVARKLMPVHWLRNTQYYPCRAGRLEKSAAYHRAPPTKVLEAGNFVRGWFSSCSMPCSTSPVYMPNKPRQPRWSPWAHRDLISTGILLWPCGEMEIGTRHTLPESDAFSFPSKNDRGVYTSTIEQACHTMCTVPWVVLKHGER